MKFDEIRDLTVDELRKRSKQLREELFEMKMKHSLGQIASPIEIRKKRKDLARVITATNAKLSQ